MLFHCTNKTIPSEVLMSRDYLRLENLSGPRGFDRSNLPDGRKFEQKSCRGVGFDRYLKIAPGLLGGGGGMVTLGID